MKVLLKILILLLMNQFNIKMANKLDQIIQVDISLKTKGITTQGFGTPLFLGESMKLSQRVKSYADTAEVLLDFAETDAEYKMAALAFSQELTPPSILIGKKVVKASTAITAATNPSGNIVNINLTGIGIAAEVGASITVSGYSTAGYNGTFEITTIVDDNNIRYTAAGALAATPAVGSGFLTLQETWSNAIQKCFDANSTWYALAITSAAEADILSSAGKIEALKRLFLARTSDADNFSSVDTGSIMYQLKALNYDRTATTYNADTVNKFIDSAWLGLMLPTVPGSENWAHKNLVGVVADDLLSSQSSEIFLNNGNTYETFAGVAITRWGTVASGEYIDTIRGADWLKARLQEVLYTLLINSSKVPLTDAGGVIIETQMRTIFDEAVRNGFIAADLNGVGLYTISIPKVSSIPLADKLNRLFSGITFEATLAGAVNKIGIAGSLSV
jgi:hypothetical protein